MSASQRLSELDAISRLRSKDPGLFNGDADKVLNRLGWIDLAEKGIASLATIDELASSAVGATDVVLLGMGGSSLASLVMGSVLESTGPRLHVVDTVAPITVSRLLRDLDPATTLYLVASKSGGTVEPNSLYSIFRDRADEVLGRDEAGKRFVAITDPGSSLESRAETDGFRAVVSAPGDVGGRFSAMSVFGLVPAALIGADIRQLLARASEAEVACASTGAGNPAVELASFMVDSYERAADKLTLVAHDGLATFGLWVEQLVAESLGKNGTGIVPVVEITGTPRGYGADRAVVVVRMSADRKLAEWADARRGIHPLFEIVLDDPYDLAEQFVVWEHAVALCGALLGVNPFDEPNVAEAKAATEAVLQGTAEAPAAQASIDGVHVTFAGSLLEPDHAERSVSTAIGHALASLNEDDYIALLAYLPDDDDLLQPLKTALAEISAKTGAAACFELGPRYLHSTGQLHKGGPKTGVFIMITTRDETDLAVPGRPWGLKALHVAQAEGDLTALAAHGRRVLRLDAPDASVESVNVLADAVRGSLAGLRAS